MDVLGGVASVITVVGLALQSTKVIYEVTSSISHGSDDINRLARATSNLEKLLEVTKRLAEHADSTNSVAEGKLLEEVKPLVDQCANALREILPKLTQLQKDPKDARWKKAKKYARLYLDTKGVTEIWNIVNHYVELLGSCLGTASVDVALYNAQKLHVLHDELWATSRDNKSQLFQVEEILRDQRALAQISWDAFQAEFHRESLNARAAATTQNQDIAEQLNTWQQQFGRAAAIGYENIGGIRKDVQDMNAIIDNKSHEASVRSEAFMTEVREGISKATSTSSAQIEENRRINAEVTQEIHRVCDLLETLPSIASEEFSTVQSLVKMLSEVQLGIRTGGQNPQTRTTTEAFLTEHDRRNDLEMGPESENKKIMARLCHFADKMTACRYSREAQAVIDDIGRLLGLVMQQISVTSPSRHDLPRKRKTLCDSHYSELETAVQSMDNLGKAKRILTASQRVQISNQDTRQIDKGDHSAILLSANSPNRLPKNGQQRKVSNVSLQSITGSWTLRHGRLDAIFRTMLLPDAEDQDTESADEAFAAKLLITPMSGPISNFQIVIDVASKTYHDRTIYLTPTLTFRAIVPDDSEVFRVVEGGSVRKLKRLLRNGAASLGDCDSMGRSLLNFALYRCRRKMAKFLIQSGADVDTLEPPHALDPVQLTNQVLVKPLAMTGFMNDFESTNHDLERVEECYKILLDAGSDLLATYTENRAIGALQTSAFTEQLMGGTLAKLKALIGLGEPSISLECTGDDNPYETIPLLLLAFSQAKLHDGAQIPDKVAFLLSRGANAKATNSLGETCLHLVFSNHEEDHYWCVHRTLQLRQLCRTKDIVILMITAGADVCAINEPGWSVSAVAIHLGQQTLWTEALKYCGIDIKDVLAQPGIDPAHSTALSSEYSQPPKSVTSKISLEEYLKRRKSFLVPEEEARSMKDQLDSSEDDNSSEDEDLDRGHCSSEDDESEDFHWAEDTSNISEVNNHKDCIAKGKAKLD